MPFTYPFAAQTDGRWHLGIGDPTAMGWITVIAYFIAAAGCFRAAARDHPSRVGRRTDPPGSPSAFWLALALAMVALGINKQLDLQSLLTQIGRDIIRSRGLYAVRHGLQRGFILFVITVCGVTLFLAFWLARRRLRDRWPALVGIIYLVGFIVLRAASFHHFDDFLMGHIGRMRWNWILELGGITWVAIAAFRIKRQSAP
jgi:hypothetical protein